MLTNFADNYFINDFINTVYNTYLLQAPAILVNYYRINKNSKFTKNYSAYKQLSNNTVYDCLMLTEAFFSSNTTKRTQTGEHSTQYFSTDQIEISIPAHIFKPNIGDKISFSTDIPTLLSRNNEKVFEITQLEFPTQFNVTNSLCKVVIIPSTNMNESMLQPYVLAHYVYLPFSKKYVKLNEYVVLIELIEYAKKCIELLNNRFVNGFMYVDLQKTTCLINPSRLFSHLYYKIGCDENTLSGVKRMLNTDTLFVKKLNDFDVSFPYIQNVNINYDLLRKYPFISKFNNVIEAISNNTTTNINTYVNTNLYQSYNIISNIKYYNPSNINVCNLFLTSLKNSNLSQYNTIEIMYVLCIIMKLENILLYDYR